MKLRAILSCLVAALAAASIGHAAPASRPNIVYILADDLGYGDIGVFYQNDRRAANDRSQPWHSTPNLDRLAAEGLQLRDHYCAAPVCAPSRASFLLGVHQGHANVRNNQFDKALEDNHTVASVLRQAGYATACIGKWGLQGKPAADASNGWPAHPLNCGFDYYFGYLSHQAGHWHYPKEDGQVVLDGTQDVAAGLDGCYTTDLFTARAKKWIAGQHTATPGQPFFLYLALDTPHAKLQSPPGPFPAGGGQRGGVQWLGQPGHMINTAGGTPDSYCHPDYASATWDDDHDPATPEKPWPDVDRRYASDVRRIDDCVGDLLQLLKDLAIDEQTLVVFTSDNGVSMESYLPEPFSPQFFRSFGPFDGIKRDCWEGGLRVGALARWPGAIPAGGISRHPSAHYDWLPTFAELAGVPAPARADGDSLVPTLRGSGEQKSSPVYVEYFLKGKTPGYPEFIAARRNRQRNQMQAVRLGDFMGVRYDIISPTQPFEIYNVVDDPEETKDLAGQGPQSAALQQQMQSTVRRLHRPDAEAKRPYDEASVPAEELSGLLPGVEWHAYRQPLSWMARLEDLAPSSRGILPRPEVGPALQPGETAAFYTGYLAVPEEGEYRFSISADQAALLRIHGITVIDADFGYARGSEIGGTIRLQAGKHPFRLYYRRGETSPPALTLSWSTAAMEKQEIPATAFFYQPSDGDKDAATKARSTLPNPQP